MLKRMFACLAFLSVAVNVARADQVILKNGDRITGAIVKSDGKTLTLKTEYAGELNIKWDIVDQITSTDPLYLITSDGRTVVGTLTARESQFDVTPKDAAKVTLERSSIAVIRSPAEQAAFERLNSPGWFDLWGGFVDFGYSLTTGNTDTSTTTLGSKIQRETRRDKTLLYAAYIKSSNDAAGETITTANAVRGGARYDYKLQPRLSVFGFGDFEYNEIQLLDLRSVIGGGVGYDVLKTERGSLQVFGGGAWNHEKYSTDISRDFGELLIGEEFNYRASDRTSFFERFTVYPNLSEGGEYRMTFDAGLTTRLTRFLDWQLTVSDRYISNPVPGSKSNDLLFTTGIRFSFQQ